MKRTRKQPGRAAAVQRKAEAKGRPESVRYPSETPTPDTFERYDDEHAGDDPLDDFESRYPDTSNW